MEAWMGIGILILIAIAAHQFAVERRLNTIELQLKALLQRFGVAPASKVVPSQHVQDLAKDPRKKVAAIKALREETGIELKEAKEIVEMLAVGIVKPHS